LAPVDKDSALEVLGHSLHRIDAHRADVGYEDLPDRLLLRRDRAGAYPVVNGIPVLMAPEMLVGAGRGVPIDTRQDPYREAYEEMDFYNAAAAEVGSDVVKSSAFEIVEHALNGGPFPGPAWMDSDYEIAAQSDAYAFMAPMEGQTAVQLGGMGIHAVKFLLAGARESWLITPVFGEAVLARDLAAAFGVEDRFRAVVGISEEIPVEDSYFDRAYSGGCVHHMVTERAFPEIKRILKSDGKFAAVEPWRAPMYSVGTKILGKRERGVNCRPLEAERVAPLFTTFESAAVNHHGTFSRYALIALGKANFRPRLATIEKISRWDDRLASRLFLERFGSSVALLARRGRTQATSS
jgi:SAM-dependent methyltransferase/uncharacterized protein YbaR (Trm112 family)